MKRQGEETTSQKHTSDLERAEMGKELSRAFEKAEALKTELRTAESRKETSDLKKEEMGKQLEKVEDQKCELKKST